METISRFKISYLQNWYVQSNIVGENFETSLPEMPENISFHPPWFEKFWYSSFRNDRTPENISFQKWAFFGRSTLSLRTKKIRVGHYMSPDAKFQGLSRYLINIDVNECIRRENFSKKPLFFLAVSTLLLFSEFWAKKM